MDVAIPDQPQGNVLFAEFVELPVTNWLVLVFRGGGMLVLIGVVVAVVLLLTSKKDQHRNGRDDRP